jgi:thiol:disulfide interchange protein
MTVSGSFRVSCWTCSAVVLSIFACAGPGAAAPFGKQGKPPANADRISFKATLGPSDVFADSNAPGVEMTQVYPGEVVTLTIVGTPKPPFHTYPLTIRTKPQIGMSCTLTYEKNPDLTPLWPVIESESEFVLEKGTGVLLEHNKPFTWTQDILVNPKAKIGPTALSFRIHVQACDDNSCLWGDHDLQIPVVIREPLPPEVVKTTGLLASLATDNPLLGLVLFYGAPVPQLTLPVTEVSPERLTQPDAREIEIPKELANQDKPDKKEDKKRNAVPGKTTPSVAIPGSDDGMLAFLLTAVGFGAISLLTPCVFPMIPITVSFFLKESEQKKAPSKPSAGSGFSKTQGEQKKQSALLLALVYSGTIVTVLTVCGMLLIPIVAPFSAYWLTNAVLGTLFLVFALSLFGMFEIVLPTWMVDLTSSREGKGGVVGTIFMALTFTMISFTCVAPFYGGFIALASSASSLSAWFKLFLGAFVYSLTFASPFFFLALFPTLLRSMPKSGAWMNTLKVVMGFLELAAALKFFRSAELYIFGGSVFFTYDLVLSLYVVLSVLCGLYLLNFYHLPHDHGKPENLGVMQLMFAIGFITLGLYLAPALFVKDPETLSRRGNLFAWVDAFLLPERQGLNWIGNLDAGLKKAREEKRRVFVDFTGITCTNCKFNENNVFVRPEIKDLLSKYVLVQLYTDSVPPEYQPTTTATENQALQESRFETLQLPYYAIVEPTPDGFKVVKGYVEGKINNVNQFADFLADNAGGK